MRYYSLTLTKPNGQVATPQSDGSFAYGGSGPTFSSLNANGSTNTSALNIEFDTIVYPFHQAQGSTHLSIWGVGLKMIAYAADFNPVIEDGVPTQFGSFTLAAGMAKGLPLANPSQSGLILRGSILQAYGNWQGVSQTLELIVNPGFLAVPFYWSWKPGQAFSDAITQTLKNALGPFSYTVPPPQVSPSLQPPNGQADAGVYTTFEQFAEYINIMTAAVGNTAGIPEYDGVQLTITGTQVNVFDGTPTPVTKTLAFQDLIGQPTWIGPTTISFKTVMRADIDIGYLVKFPTGTIAPYALTTPLAAISSLAPARSSSVFQGSFVVNEIHHFANFRQADADSWSTAFTAVVVGSNG